MSIGDRITTLRKERNLSQIDLAHALGVSRQAVSKWENNQSSPDTVKLIQLADLLNTEVEYLATGNRPSRPSEPITVTVVEHVDRYVDRIIEKPVIHKLRRFRYVRNPVEFALCGAAGLIIGILIGLLF